MTNGSKPNLLISITRHPSLSISHPLISGAGGVGAGGGGHRGDTEGKEEEPKAKNEETDSEVKMGQKGGRMHN